MLVNRCALVRMKGITVKYRDGTIMRFSLVLLLWGLRGTLGIAAENGVAARWVEGEWLEVREQIHQLMKEGKTTSGSTLQKRVQDLEERRTRLDVTNGQAVTTFWGDCMNLRAEVARPLLGTGLVCWKVDPWADLRGSIFAPFPPSAPGEISLAMWQDEYEAAALGFTNLKTNTTRLTVLLSPLENAQGQAVSSTQRVWLREARAVAVRKGYRVLDALPMVGIGDAERAGLIVPPGESRVLWLTIRSLDLPPGRYQTKLRIVAEPGAEEQVVALRVSVAPLRMPKADERALRCYVWDYVRGYNLPKESVEDMRAHGVNLFVIHPESLPVPVFNADRTRVESVDFKLFDEALARAGHPRWHTLFWGEEQNRPFNFDLEKATERDCFKQWIAAWVTHLREQGLGYETFCFYPYDEKIPDRFVPIARLIKEVEPRLQIYCNTINVSPEIMERIAPYIDVWCPYYRTLTGEITAAQRQAFQTVRATNHPQVWTYACDGPAKTLSPDRYYRQLSWLAFSQGATGAGFWSYASSSGESIWDDTDGSDSDYAVIYFAEDAPPGVSRGQAIIPSRRWEAWREGTEDYEYLYQLRKTIQQAREARVNQTLLANADRVLQQTVKDVLDDSTTPRYQQARAILTDTILDLRKAMVQLESTAPR